ncbi:MAG TPA: NAD-dependent epimerase/dehydratase family protein [Pyrinomonadaceae bacterium]|nr:NAD-dependent epimerase/dehydratase family protein [Pyrinomonadaceae bacterium]
MSDIWKGRRTFITGATGFLGANLVKRLVDGGALVVCLQRDASQPNSFDLFDLRDRVTVVNGEVQDLQLLQRVLNEYEIDSVFHLAAQAIVGAANRSPVSTFETNIRGTYLLLEACRLSQTVTRVIVASSDKAYGSNPTLPYVEDFPLQGTFPYDVSKSCTDLIARSYALTYGLPVVITRSANIYGPGDINLSRIIPGTIVSVLKNESPIIRSDGTPLREFVYVDDVVSAYLTIAEKIEQTGGEAFNIGTDKPVQILELTNKIIRLGGYDGQLEPTILLQRKIDHEIDAQFLSAEKIRARVGWTAEVALDDGLERTIEWYRENLNKLS